MPPAAQTILSLCCLRRRTSRSGGDSYPKKDSQSPCNKVAATLLTDVQIRQEYDRYHFCAGHTLVHTGIQGAISQDKHPSTTLGRCRWDQTIQVSAPLYSNPKKSFHPIPTLYTSQSRWQNLSQGSSKSAPSSSWTWTEIAQEGVTEANKGGQVTPATL